METFNPNPEQNAAALKIPVDIYRRILAKAVTQTKQDLARLKNAVELKQFDAIQEISHRLKGDYSNLRLMELSAIAKQINEEAKAAQNMSRIHGWVASFSNLFGQLEKFMNP